MTTQHHHEHVEASPVEVTGRVIVGDAVRTKPEASDYGSYTTFVFAGTEAPVRALPFDAKRSRGYLTVSGTGPVWIGTKEQCQAVQQGNTSGGGGQVATGQTVTVEHKQEVWLVPDGTHGATVLVVNQRWA